MLSSYYPIINLVKWVQRVARFIAVGAHYLFLNGKNKQKAPHLCSTAFCILSWFLPCCKNKNESIQIVLLLLSLLLLLEQVVAAPIPAVKNHYTYSLYRQEHWFKNCIIWFFFSPSLPPTVLFISF